MYSQTVKVSYKMSYPIYPIYTLYTLYIVARLYIL